MKEFEHRKQKELAEIERQRQLEQASQADTTRKQLLRLKQQMEELEVQSEFHQNKISELNH